jgi:aspartate/methionine/tyrosine aminotransferase
VTVRFPLADWIDDHADCRFNFGSSGMWGTVRHPEPTRAEVRRASEVELRRRFAELLGVDASRLFLTHGGTEANALAVSFLSRRGFRRHARCRIALPEYPPLYDAATEHGFRLTTGTASADLAIVSQPRNPVGDRWDPERLREWCGDTRATLVDETFREFTPARSVQHLDLPGLWTSGSMTKVYAADDLRVGYVVAPEEERPAFARYHGLVEDEMANYSVAGALATLAARDRLLRVVRSILDRNRTVWSRATPGRPRISGSVAFDDPVLPDGDRFARRCLRASVLVSPGSLFGRASGVRVGLTRRSFPADLRAYLRVRAATETRSGRSPGRGKVRRVDRTAG